MVRIQKRNATLTINISANERYSLLGIFAILQECMETQIAFNFGQYRIGVSPSVIGGNSWVTELFGWKPEVEVYHCIRNLIRVV